MKKTTIVFVAFVLLLIISTADALYIRSLSNWQPKVTVVCAKTRIPAKTIITKDMVELRDIDSRYANKLAEKDLTDVIGQKAKHDIETDEQILESKLGKADEMEIIPVKNKESRLFTLQLEPDQANAWWLMVDQYVDIIYVPDSNSSIMQNPVPGQAQKAPPEGENQGQGQGVQRLNNIRIAALFDEKLQRLDNGKRETTPVYVAFEVTTQQDEFLAYAKSNGRLEISAIPPAESN